MLMLSFIQTNAWFRAIDCSDSPMSFARNLLNSVSAAPMVSISGSEVAFRCSLRSRPAKCLCTASLRSSLRILFDILQERISIRALSELYCCRERSKP